MLDKSALPAYIDPDIAAGAHRVVNALRTYHRYHIQGLDHLPTTGPALLVVSHSLATYDIALLGYTIFEATGRVVRGLADRLIFKIPPLARLAKGLGGVQGEPQVAEKLLRDGEIVMVAPGGMREALRTSEHRYQVSWENRLGFARLAVRAQVPVVLAACPAADDLYTLYPSRLTNYFLKRFHLPVPMVRGVGPSWVPRPVALTHYLSAPLAPPAVSEDDGEAVVAYQRHLATQMTGLLAQHMRGARGGGGLEA